MTGAPERIRTSDPQIRRLGKSLDLKRFPCKPTFSQGLSDQCVSGSLQTDPNAEKSPGSLAGDTGAPFDDRLITRERYQRAALKASWARLTARQKRAVRMLALSLFLDDPLQWLRLAKVMNAGLSGRERGMLAFAALRSLEPDPREAVFDAAHWGVVAR
jgi:hypothetical protein